MNARKFRIGWALILIIVVLAGTGVFLNRDKIAAFAATIQARITPPTLETGLVGYWSFNGPDLTDKVYDRSTVGNHGTYYNGVTSTAKISGKIGQALKMITGYVPLNVTFPIGANTFSAWIYTTDVTTQQMIVGRLANNGNTADGLGMFISGGLLIGLAAEGNSAWNSNLRTGITANAWHHVVFTVTGQGASQTGKLYIDGEYKVSYTGTAGYNSAYGPAIGAGRVVNQYTFGSPFLGTIDEVRIYSRAISDDEVKHLYNQGGGSKRNAFEPDKLRIIRTLDDPANDVGYLTSIAIGSDGYPVISYRDNTALSLKFYKCNDATCSSGSASTLDDPANNVGEHTSIAIGSDGYPVISYRDASAGALKLYKCDNAACSSGTASTLEDIANSVGYYTSIAIGSDGYPVISHYNGSAGALKLYKCNDAACTTGTSSTLEDVANLVGSYTSIAIGSDGYPVISYQNSTLSSLKLYKCNDAACSSGTASTLDGPGNWVGFFTSIAIGRDGYPVISYYDNTAGALKLYKCDNAACSSGTASALDDPTNDVGYYSAIAIGSDGYPVISYRDNTAGALKLYKCDNTACSSGTASTLEDTVNDVGYFTSIAIGSDGHPVIAYRDLTASSLKFAYVGGQTTINTSQNNELTTGLVGLWSFDGPDVTDKVYDRSGNGNNGYFVGGATTSAKTSGKVGQALNFDGVNDYIGIPQNGQFNLSSSPFTISLWILDDSNLVSGYHRIVSWYDGTNNIQFGLYGRAFYIQNANSGGAKQHTANAGTGWNHVVATFDGSTTYHMYLNGVLSDSSGAAAPIAFTSNTTTLYLGQRGDSAAYMSGKLDEVRIYNLALSADEIKHLYNKGR